MKTLMEIVKEIAAAEKQLAALRASALTLLGASAAPAVSEPPTKAVAVDEKPKRKRRVSETQRAAMRAAWARRKAAKASAAPVEPPATAPMARDGEWADHPG